MFIGSCIGRATELPLLVTAGQTVLDEQRAAIDRIVDRGGEMIRITWHSDSTPQKVALQSPEAVSIASGTKSVREEGKHRGTREAFVQRCVLETDVTLPEQVLVPPVVMGDSMSGSLLDAILSSMSRVGFPLDQVAERFRTVLLAFGSDGGSNMILTIDYIRHVLRATLQNVIVVGLMLDQGGSCLMHALNRVVACHAEGSRDVNLPGLLTFSKLFAVEKYWDRFCDAVCAEAVSDVAWTQFGTICPQQERRIGRKIPDGVLPFARD